jgi:hypothetical protein
MADIAIDEVLVRRRVLHRMKEGIGGAATYLGHKISEREIFSLHRATEDALFMFNC